MSCLWASKMRKFEKIRLYLLPIRKLRGWQNVQNSYLPGTVHWTLIKNPAKNSHRWEMVREEPILSCGLFEVPLHTLPPFPWAHSAAQRGSRGHISAPVQCPSSDRLDCSAMLSSLARRGSANPAPLLWRRAEGMCWEAGMGENLASFWFLRQF